MMTEHDCEMLDYRVTCMINYSVFLLNHPCIKALHLCFNAWSGCYSIEMEDLLLLFDIKYLYFSDADS
mgnify:FL=1